MAKKLIIALGTGRCGSKSLATLMNLQKGVEFYHEFARLPWIQDRKRLNGYLDAFAEYDGTEVLGDFGNWYVRYVGEIYARFGESVKFLYLKRPKEEVVRSFLQKVVRGNHWIKEGSKFLTGNEKTSAFDECYPKYDAPKKESIEQYWEDYEILVKEAHQKHCPIATFTLDIFKNDGKQEDLFNYLEIPRENRHYCYTIVENRGHNLKSFMNREGAA